jgi:hypothetical protein
MTDSLQELIVAAGHVDFRINRMIQELLPDDKKELRPGAQLTIPKEVAGFKAILQSLSNEQENAMANVIRFIKAGSPHLTHVPNGCRFNRYKQFLEVELRENLF